MTPLNREEVSAYLDTQMKLAGANHRIFLDGAVEAIATVSRGYPRIINSLAIGSLIYGFQNDLPADRRRSCASGGNQHGDVILISGNVRDTQTANVQNHRSDNLTICKTDGQTVCKSCTLPGF